MEMEILKKKKDRGFTLVELLIVIFAFGIVIIAITGISQSIIKAQYKAFALQEVQESGRYLLEAMSKEIRMSTINTGGVGETSADTLNIANARGQTVVYYFNGANNKIEKQINGGVWEDISPANLDLTGSFYIRKSGAPAPRALVTINMNIESSGLRVEQAANIYLQSSISSRSWDY